MQANGRKRILALKIAYDRQMIVKRDLRKNRERERETGVKTDGCKKKTEKEQIGRLEVNVGW
jgi:hypothetical protein